MSMVELFGKQMSESDAEDMISEDARGLIEQLRTRNAGLERQLAEQRESWKDLRNILECTQQELATMEKRAEQAEQRIAESREQSPHSYSGAGTPLYQTPIVPPDVEEAVKAEREACAKICDDTGPDDLTSENCSAAIRARGGK